jgi:N-methylhydantoinase B
MVTTTLDLPVDTIEYAPGTEPAVKMDPVTAQVIAGALESIAMEMGHKLARMSYSTIIRESEDFGACILDRQGRGLCECPLSTPLQLGPIPGYMRGILKLFEDRGDRFSEGDVVLHNCPFHGASHAPDIGFCVPIFYRGELVGFSFTTAHHLDIGSQKPASCGIVDACDTYAEGLRFEAIKVYEKGQKLEQVWRILRQNIRASDLVVGDMEAQIAACRIGAERYVELLDRYGLETVTAASDWLLNYSERMMRSEIEKLPAGTYYAEQYIDGFLDDPDPSKKDLKIAVTVTIEGSEITIDFTGTSPQIPDRSINMPFVGTVDVALYVTLRSVLLDQATHEYVPQNSGLVRPIRIRAPRGCLANPTFPASTIARYAPGNAVCVALLKALAPACPDRVVAGPGINRVIAYSGMAGKDYWIYMDIGEAGYGGGSGRDGIGPVDTLFANTRNNPIEDIETHLPLRVLRYELREDSAGAGRWRGSLGSIREVQFLAPGGMSFEADGHKYGPHGLFGGMPGLPAALELVRAKTDETVSLPSKIAWRAAEPGDVTRMITPSGGGYGEPFEREVNLVLQDVLNEHISAGTAQRDYGVVVDLQTRSVDRAATERLRASRRGG